MDSKQSKNWFLTHNNPALDWKKQVDDIQADYFIGQLEKGEQGTIHIQGLCYFQKKKRLGGVKKLLNCHWEIPRDLGASLKYVQKEETRVDGPYTYGIQPKEFQKKRTCKEMLEIDLKEAVDLNLVRWQDYKKLVENQNLYKLTLVEKKIQLDVVGWWVYGKPGVGKSHYARFELAEGKKYYLKQQNKWWDGYQQEPIVILDDFDCKELGHLLKIWLDKWDKIGEVKFGTIPLNYERFIITSNYEPEDLWNPMDNKESLIIEAIRRRCKFYHMLKRFDE